MVYITCFSLEKEVKDGIEAIPYGERSAIVNEALKAYFEINGGAKPEPKPRLKRYPAEEITVEQL